MLIWDVSSSPNRTQPCFDLKDCFFVSFSSRDSNPLDFLDWEFFLNRDVAPLERIIEEA